MPRIDVTDEGTVDANPSAVFEALLNEFEGAQKWWMPHWEAKLRGNIPFRQQGGIIDITVHRIGTPRFAAKSIEIIKDKLIRAEFFEGDFIGSGEWTLEPLDGKTKVKFRFNIKTNRTLFSVLYPIVRRIHSGVMQKGFESLNRFLNRR
jgi:uncharacterized protein YndB with AHSA1/START domain